MKTCIFKHKNLLPIYPVTIGTETHQSYIDRPFGFAINQIFIVNGGTGTLCTGGKITEIEKGDMFFLKKDTAHSYGGDGKFSTVYLGFDGDLCGNIFEYFGVENGMVYRGKNYEAAKQEILDFFDEFENIGDSAKLSARTYSVVTAFFGEAVRSKTAPIERVKKYLEANYGKMLSLQDITELYPYSKSKLCRDFFAKYGMSIFDMLTKIRLNHAKIMLKSDPCISLKEVAENCGFNDTSYFCKMYKKAFGVSPKKGMN